jgi:hypothetical protein
MDFKTLNNFYAKDAKSGFLISPKTQMFRPLPADRMDTTCFSYNRIEGSDGPTFTVLTADPYARYACDRRFGYFCGKRIEGCDGASLEDLGCNYARDARSVIYRGRIVGTADRATFVRLGGPGCAYAADKAHVYCGDIDSLVVMLADSVSFTVLNNYFARDSARVFCNATVLTGADQATFEIVPRPPFLVGTADKNGLASSPYGKDGTGVFYFGKRMDGADPRTFRYVSQLFAKDDRSVYYAGKHLREADAATFLYFADRKTRTWRGRPYDAEDKNNRYIEASPTCQVIKVRRGR